jgi:hypothetical protein
MLVLAVPGTALALLLLVLPGLIWAWWCYPATDGTSRLSVGFAVGLALQMFLLILLGSGPGITRASITLSTLALTLVAVLLAWCTHLPRHARTHQRGLYALPLALGALLVPRVIPLFIDSVPQGWDPSFHSLLASTTVATGHLPTWAPYEPILLNYPYGSHLVIAALALLSGIAPDAVFAALLSVLVPLLTGICLYALTKRVFRRNDIAIGAIIAYGLLGNLGSLDYTRWGGLPNAFGFALLLVFFVILFAPGFAAYRIIIGGMVLGSIVLMHNHVFLTAGLMLSAYAGYLVLRARGIGGGKGKSRQISEVAARRGFWRLVLTSLVALVATGFYVIPLLLRAGQLQDTGVLRLIETVNGLPFAYNGWVLWCMAILGVGLLYVPFWGNRHVLLSGRAGTREARAFLAIALATLAVAFCLGYYGYRAYALAVYHQPYTAFTPSRFLTDMTYFLAIYGGVALAALWQVGTHHVASIATSARFSLENAASGWRLAVVRPILLVVVLLTASVTIWPQIFVGNRDLPGTLAPGELAAFAWIRAHTPTNALIINLDPSAPWAPYFTQRKVAFTPIPTDEFTHGYVNEKRFLVNILLDVFKDPKARVLAVANTGSALGSLLEQPVFILTPQLLTDLAGPPVYSSGAEHVYLLPSGFLRLQPAGVSLIYTISAEWWTDTQQTPPRDWDRQSADSLHWSDTSSGRASASGVRYARITIDGALLPAMKIVCQSEDGATVYVDGTEVPGGCSGKWVDLPEMSSGSRHVIALQITHGGDLQTWGDMFLRTG